MLATCVRACTTRHHDDDVGDGDTKQNNLSARLIHSRVCVRVRVRVAAVVVFVVVAVVQNPKNIRTRIFVQCRRRRRRQSLACCARCTDEQHTTTTD